MCPAPVHPLRPHPYLSRLVLGLSVVVLGLFLIYWVWRRPLPPSGGVYFTTRVALAVPPFRQNDPLWGNDLLGTTPGTLGAEGCAVTSAAMVLGYYGIDTDPQRLNRFLTDHGGYTPNGWMQWEGPAALEPGVIAKAYEDLPSYYLIDWNLWRHNPVIIRLHLQGGSTHFVVIVGKEGWNYLILDPGAGFSKGIYPLRDLGVPIQALRFYRRLKPVAAPAAPPDVARLFFEYRHEAS